MITSREQLAQSYFRPQPGLVADPKAELEDEDRLEPRWTPEERKIFADQYALHPKVGITEVLCTHFCLMSCLKGDAGSTAQGGRK